MRFGTWYPLARAAELAPAEPGVFQVRVETGLIEYPKGRSAMVHYGAADDVRAAVVEFAARHAGEPWLCRHAIALSAGERADPHAACERLVQRFTRQFGSAPRVA